MLSAANGQPRFVTAQQVEDYRQQVEIAKAEARDAKQAAQTAIERETGQFRAEYPANLKFLYRFETAKRPFNVSAMYTDGKFTYIQAHPVIASDIGWAVRDSYRIVTGEEMGQPPNKN